MLDVCFFEVFDDEKRALHRFLPANVKARFEKKTIQEAGLHLPPARLICVRTQSKIPVSWFNQIDGVFSRSRGYDHLIALRRNQEKKIVCGCLEEYCSDAVAEHAVMMALVLIRNIKKQIRQFESFDREGLTGMEVFGKTVVIVGVGAIGSKIIDLLKGFRVQILGVDIVRRRKDIRYVSLAEGMRKADVVFCAAPLTEKTRGAINIRRLRMNKKKPIVVNVSRGEITPLTQMKQLLKRGTIRGLGMDVFPEEDFLAEALRGKRRAPGQTVKNILELNKYDNVIFTPHNAFNSVEALERKARQTAKSVQYFLKTGCFIREI